MNMFGAGLMNKLKKPSTDPESQPDGAQKPD
jgi:hypothetical protein